MGVNWEVVLGLVIIAFTVYVIWRGGSANPVGTGQLQNQLNTLGGRVGKIEAGLAGCATTAELGKLRGELQAMEGRVASSGEVVALEGQIAALNMRIAGIEKLVERTDAGVARIEGYFLEKGIRGQ